MKLMMSSQMTTLSSYQNPLLEKWQKWLVKFRVPKILRCCLLLLFPLRPLVPLRYPLL